MTFDSYAIYRVIKLTDCLSVNFNSFDNRTKSETEQRLCYWPYNEKIA